MTSIKTSKGRKLAKEILTCRRKLRPYLTKIRVGSRLTAEQSTDVVRLASHIDRAKTELEALGFHVENSVIAAAKETASEKKVRKKVKKGKKGKNFKTRRKSGGVGMYGFGSGMRNWK